MRNIYQFQTPIRMIEAKHGAFLYNQFCQWVGRALEVYGEYCEHEVQFFKHIIKPSHTVWEVGANTGSQAVPLAKLVNQGIYIGFEPQPELFKILVSNLCINGLANAHAFNYALGSEEKLIELPAIDYCRPGNFGGVSLLNEGDSGLKVECRIADSLEWLPSPDFIKIDVEGMEIDVLKGAQGIISNNRPTMYIENDRVERSSALIKFLFDLNYDLYWHITPYYNRENFFGVGYNLWPGIASFNMICFPGEKGVKVEGLKKVEDSEYHPLKDS